jgi:hypothetical protein
MPSFSLDPRYPTPIYLPPKFDYMWKPEKLIYLDPKPGQPGYFAVLVRENANCVNSATLSKYVIKGQELFRKLGVTNIQMKTARAGAERTLQDSRRSIDQEWNDTLISEGLPIIEEEWDCTLVEWRNCCAEIAAYNGAADPVWIRKLQDALSALEQNISCDVSVLRNAVHRRVTSVLASYTNEFKHLYGMLGDKATEFIKFEKSLSEVVPVVAHAPWSAPVGLGRNARFGMTPCADVVVRFNIDNKLYVGVIKPQDDIGVSKMLGGKCDPKYDVAEDGSVRVTVDTVESTAVKEFMEESGANKANEEVILYEAQTDLLNRVVPNWRVELENLGCVISSTNDTKTTVTWTKLAMETTEKGITELLRPTILNAPVPDNRTTQNAGYITTVYDVSVDITQCKFLALLLTLRGGDDAADFGFYCPITVTMQSTHDQIFRQYLEMVSPGI